MSNRTIVGADTLLLEEYANAAIQQGRATLSGDYTTGNLASDILTGIYRRLKSEGVEAQRRLQVLLNHPDRSVRAWAATHTLEVGPEESERVLQEEASGDDILAFDAQMVLELWRKGTLFQG